MCGIVGLASHFAAVDRTWLLSARELLLHRGPDGAGEWWSHDGRVGLGHRRLAIVDLSATGYQPMHDPTGRFTIVFNGEIYNHRDLRRELIARGYSFRSRSDTEVLLAAYREWGDSCLSHLNGMFAFAVFDAEQRTVGGALDVATISSVRN